MKEITIFYSEDFVQGSAEVQHQVDGWYFMLISTYGNKETPEPIRFDQIAKLHKISDYKTSKSSWFFFSQRFNLVSFEATLVDGRSFCSEMDESIYKKLHAIVHK